MREIKFRGKRIIEPIKIERYAPDGWVYGDLLNCLDEMYISPTDISGEMYIDEPYRFRANDFETRVVVAQVDPESIGQFTGLYDKNGKEIYEGDILQLNDRLVKVIWDEYNACFDCNFIKYISNKPDKEYSFRGLGKSTWWKMYEVIGNIYDNPELIKE